MNDADWSRIVILSAQIFALTCADACAVSTGGAAVLHAEPVETRRSAPHHGVTGDDPVQVS
jgi:hypothetical protein